MDTVDLVQEQTPIKAPHQSINPLDRSILLYSDQYRTRYPKAEIRLHGISPDYDIDRSGNLTFEFLQNTQGNFITEAEMVKLSGRY